jgi:hypothetical protein
MAGEWQNDGSYAPNWASMTTPDDDLNYHRLRISNASVLREGYIVGKHHPDDPKDPDYANRKSIVYDVLCMQYNNGGPLTPDKVQCELLTPLGSMSDKGEITLRTPKSWNWPEMTDNPDLNRSKVGSALQNLVRKTTRVLVLFLNGRTDKGIIIGCLPNEQGVDGTAEKMKLEDGHHYSHYFNGISTEINKEGEYLVVSTLNVLDTEENIVPDPDPDKAGTFIKIDKDGSVFLDANPDYIAIDKVNHNLELYAQENTYIGSPTTSTENLVLGQKLVAALTQLITLLTTPPLTGPAIPGQPLPMNPALIPLLKPGWINMYLGTPPSPTTVLAEKKFTE